MTQTSLSLTVIGSGTGVPLPHRSSPAYLLEAGGGQWLVDCGSGTLRRLVEMGRDYRELDGVLASHIHLDHIGDLPPLMHALKVATFLEGPRDKPFLLSGPKDFLAWYHDCVATMVPPGEMDLPEQEVPAAFDLANLRVQSAPTIHSSRIQSVGYRFESDSSTLVFSGDADYDESLAKFAHGAEVLIIDCSFPDALKINGHLSAGECGRVAAEAGVKRLVLSHLYPVPEGQETRVAEAQAQCECPVELARDGLAITL